ncbi:hypothetical protein Vretimale_743 [Volvox reticuliferus]|uniref:Uncharacterized protein n=1 Tax=Volvox reticuliferus TaxID=1737510 RepID=A0A8J4G1H1_9CHLO|nr:hypothetical protein Vretimale_743 [Volvox reticuliferus]
MKSYLGWRFMLLIIFILWDVAFAEQSAKEGFRGKTTLDIVLFLLTSITAIVSSAYILLGASVACQWPHPTCWCYTYPASDRVNGRCCSLYYANWAMAILWLLLATVSAISRNASRLAVCLGYTLAHTLIIIFMRYKFSRFGSPVGPNGNDGSLVIPLERFGERAQNRASFSSFQQLRLRGPLDPHSSPPQQQQIPSNANGNTTTEANCVVGIPAYNLPILLAVVGKCAAGCTCPYCCFSIVAEAAGEAASAGEAAQQRERDSNLCWITHRVVPYDRVHELYLPGALQPAETGQEERGVGSFPESHYISMHTSLPYLSSPSPSSLQSPSRPRSLSPTRAPAASSDRSALSLAAWSAVSSGLLAVGVPVPQALLLVEGIPLADILRDRRGGDRELPGGGTSGSDRIEGTGTGTGTGVEPGRMVTGTENGIARTGAGTPAPPGDSWGGHN